jgi:hypothetical protein
MSTHLPAATGSILIGDLYLSVLNRHHGGVPDGASYIGRGSKWGNPFVIGKDGSRDEVIAKYEAYLVSSGLIDDIHELRGRNLVCYCAPLRCHGDILLVRANFGCAETTGATH